VAGVLLVVIVAAFGVLISLQYRGTFASRTQLTVVSPRAGLVVDPGSKVTFNGVIGSGRHLHRRVDGIEQAALSLEVDDRYLPLIPTNVVADVRASTVFGNKYVAFSSKKILPHNIFLPRHDTGGVGDHRVQHAVRDRDVDRAEGRPDQAEPDADLAAQALSGLETASASRRACQRHPR
jgi:phospholipid/cholesterol/gamma-HCH transport system substrate-binding protein